MSVIDYKKFPYHGVGFAATPDIWKALKPLVDSGEYATDDLNDRIKPYSVRNLNLRVDRKKVLREVRDAIVNSDVNIRDEDTTTDGRYRSNWIVFDQYALRICGLRIGGYGAILEARETFDKERRESKNVVRALAEKDKERTVKVSGVGWLCVRKPGGQWLPTFELTPQQIKAWNEVSK